MSASDQIGHVIYTDIGVNLCSKQFQKPQEILDRAWHNWVGYIISISNSFQECHDNLEMCRQFHNDYGLYCTMGVHPHNAKQLNYSKLKELTELIKQNRQYVVAVGECGLDYNRNFSPPEIQRKWFEAQIKLALEVDLPLYFHERDAFIDFCQIVEKYDLRNRAVIHCFTGNETALKKYLELGFYIGITGWVCDEKRGQTLRKIVPLIPLDRLLLETDAPFLTPQDIQPRPRFNEPVYLTSVIFKVAALYKMHPDEIANITTNNAKRFFRIK